MIEVWVELSQENLPLAAAELDGAVAALAGRARQRTSSPLPPVLGAVEVPMVADGGRLAGRLAFARRVLQPWPEAGVEALCDRLERVGTHRESIAIRPLRGGRVALPEEDLHALASAFVRGGGRIDLADPDRVLWVVGPRPWRLAEQVAEIDRSTFEARRMPKLPFQRPVSLAPRLARAAVNLAAVGPGHQVVDPFLGTGALLLEAALVGARITGVDRDPEMVRGALRNLEAHQVVPDSVRVADAGDPFAPPRGGRWDAIVTDPPYGRSSGSGGEPPEQLLRRVLPQWAEHVAPQGRISLVVPGGPDPLPSTWERTVCVPDRVHRSLTREFRVYRRSDEISRR